MSVAIGDLDSDGDTGQADLGILLAHWGERCSYPSARSN
jgi:hypothetical protein